MHGIIQVAGIVDQKEADMLIAEGVHRLGFPCGLTVHREDLGEEEAALIVRTLKPPRKAVLITYESEAERIVGRCRRIGVEMVQLQGEVSIRQLVRLRELAPHFVVVKSLIVRDHNLAELESSLNMCVPYVDGFITDTYDPVSGASGATGKAHDWDVSRWLVTVSPKPIMLAGGLTVENVRSAIIHVRPAGVDVHTGVEGSDGRKDRLLVRAFVREAMAAFARVQ
ncbi:MAG: phosphoribosylanthranilate isomerase [Deltaproteobacteria bacterium]|nr:phosphoribosylanthranilate isomerase [Deltaproteobacteria bacterium]